MASEIGNKALLRAKAERLLIRDQKILPGVIATDQVIPTCEIDPQYVGPTFGAQSVLYDTGIEALSGITNVDFEMMPAQADGVNTEILALNLKISGDAGVNPAYGQLEIYYQLPVGQPFRIVDMSEGWFCDGALDWFWNFSLGGFSNQHLFASQPVAFGASSWDGFVPGQVPIRVALRKGNGAFAFNVNDSITWSFFARQWPVGTLKPY